MQHPTTTRSPILIGAATEQNTLIVRSEVGLFYKHPNCRVAYVAQHAFHHIEEHLDATPNQYLRRRYLTGEDKEEALKVSRVISKEEEEKIKKQIWEIDGQVTLSGHYNTTTALCSCCHQSCHILLPTTPLPHTIALLTKSLPHATTTTTTANTTTTYYYIPHHCYILLQITPLLHTIVHHGHILLHYLPNHYHMQLLLLLPPLLLLTCT
jgi:hypothetical protein